MSCWRKLSLRVSLENLVTGATLRLPYCCVLAIQDVSPELLYQTPCVLADASTQPSETGMLCSCKLQYILHVTLAMGFANSNRRETNPIKVTHSDRNGKTVKISFSEV